MTLRLTSEHTLTRAERSLVAIVGFLPEVCDSSRRPAVKKKPTKSQQKANKRPTKADRTADGAGAAHCTARLAGAAARRTDAQGAGAAG